MDKAVFWRITRFAVACLLACAVVMKFLFLSSPSSAWRGDNPLPWSLLCGLEASVAWRLVSGRSVLTSWLLSVLLFAAFAAVSVWKLIRGAESCGCFGSFSIPPIVTASLDTAMLLLLFVSGRHVLTCESQGAAWFNLRELVRLATASVVIGGVVFMAASAGGRRETRDHGVFSVGGSIVLVPEEWVGKRMPIVAAIEHGEALQSGPWRVYFVHHECPTCRKLLAQPRLDDRADERVAIVQIPPIGHLPVDVQRVELVSALAPERDWLLATPTVLLMRDGIVSAVKVP